MNNISNNGHSHVNSSFGRIDIDQNGNGITLSQQGYGIAKGTIQLTPDEMEKLGKALLAIKGKITTNKKQNISVSKVGIPRVSPTTKTSTTNHMTDLKAKHEKAYAPWLPDEEEKLKQYHSMGKTMLEIAQLLKRNEGAIKSRMKKLGLS